jgi:2C-methyl-D-erythritol 2,4-cyclodiphosphate synthase
MGMSVGERSMRMNALEQVLQHHGMDQQTGMTGVMSDQSSTYRARVDMLRLAGIQQPELYYVDPNSPQAQQAQQAAQQAAQQQQQMMQQKEQQMMQFQYGLMTDIEKVKAEAKLMAQQMADQTKAQLQQMEIQAKRMEAMLQQAERMFGHRKDLAIAQGEWDQKEAQRDVDALQAEADRKLKAGEALTRGEIELLKARRQGAQQ